MGAISGEHHRSLLLRKPQIAYTITRPHIKSECPKLAGELRLEIEALAALAAEIAAPTG
jgi:hypothetical protein